jgi:hypothetical protein
MLLARLGKTQQRNVGTRCGRGNYPVNPVAFEKTRLSAGSVLSCQPLSDRTLSPWHHKDNVVISFSSRLCLVCLLAKGNLLSGRPHTHTHTHTHTHIYTHTHTHTNTHTNMWGLHATSPSGRKFLVLEKRPSSWYNLRNYWLFTSLYALSTEGRGRT